MKKIIDLLLEMARELDSLHRKLDELSLRIDNHNSDKNS